MALEAEMVARKAWEPEREISTVRDLVTWAEETDNYHYPSPFAFRGQSNSDWRLVPTAHRAVPKAQWPILNLFELGVAKAFFKRAHAFVPHGVIGALPLRGTLNEFNVSELLSSDVCLLWAIMRHYGAPTRILDWTFSPYIAAYFAVKDGWGRSEWDPPRDGVIYFYEPSVLRSLVHVRHPKGREFDRSGAWFFGDQVTPPLFTDYEVTQEVARMYVQQSRFTVCTDSTLDHEQAFEGVAPPGQGFTYGRVIIKAEGKPSIFKHLYLMGIRAASLFPGFEGFGASLGEYFRLDEREIGKAIEKAGKARLR